MSPKWQECIRMWYHYSKSSLLLNLKVLKTSWKLTHKNLSFFSSLLFSIFTCCIILSFAFSSSWQVVFLCFVPKNNTGSKRPPSHRLCATVTAFRHSSLVSHVATPGHGLRIPDLMSCCGVSSSCYQPLTSKFVENLLKICWKFVENHDFHIAHIFTLAQTVAFCAPVEDLRDTVSTPNRIQTCPPDVARRTWIWI